VLWLKRFLKRELQKSEPDFPGWFTFAAAVEFFECWSLWLDTLAHRRHSQIAGPWQDVNGSSDLQVAGGYEDSISYHSTVGGSHDVESQLEIDERPI
jgi:hypothetical protein